MQRLAIFALCILALAACGKKEGSPAAAAQAVGEPGHLLCVVLLEGKADADKEVLRDLAAARKEFGKRIRSLIVEGEAPEVEAFFTAEGLPAVFLNSRSASEGGDIAKAGRAILNSAPRGTHLDLEIIPADTGNLEIAYAGCCDEGVSLEGGTVALFLARKVPEKGNVFAGAVHTETGYAIGANSCHRPGNAALPIPEGTAPEALKVIGVIFGADGTVLATACTETGCGEETP